MTSISLGPWGQGLPCQWLRLKQGAQVGQGLKKITGIKANPSFPEILSTEQYTDDVLREVTTKKQSNTTSVL